MRYGYYLKRAVRELWYTIRHPRRRDFFELPYAWGTLLDATTWPLRRPFYIARNIWAYFDLLKDDRDWDWSFLLELMERKLRRMSNYHRLHGVGVDSGRRARQMHIASLLCKRIRKDEYLDHIPGSTTHRSILHADAQQKRDIQYLGHLFNKHLLSWWD